MFKPVDNKVSFPKLEEEVLAFWQEHQVFQKSLDQRNGSPEYVFFDGPPFATGLPHFGHFVPGTIKDIIPRYKTMKGFRVDRRFGWDCHGLPVEYEMEKELGISGKRAIEDYGVANFNEACRSIVLRYTKEWRTIMTRAGRWVDFDRDYKTMDPDYMESIWWVVKRLWDEGLIYEGHTIMPYCPRCSTVLSNHELAQGGYKDVHDPAITVKFKITGNPEAAAAGSPLASLADGKTFLLAWTTTPWTLPSNLALAAGPEVDYVLVADGDERYVLAEARLAAYYKDPASVQILARCKGTDLLGTAYEPLFPYFGEHAASGAFRVYPADYVTTEDGAGIVHTAPGFGEDDYQTLKHTGIPTICPVDGECKFTPEVSDFAGMFVKDADKPIIERLKTEGKLVKREQYLHAYPHCWRCSSPLIYRAISSWFVKIDPIKPKFLNANQKITWVPHHIRDGRFGKWLENARDWSISRNRYWGNPLPIWKCDSCQATTCVGSRDELKALSGTRPDDLHKHFVDDISWKCSCGGTMQRIPEVLDCWFESGSMPYAQVHYPFENKEHFEANFPANFISEGLDQTRGWFYTLTVLAAALFDKPAFEACIVNGLILATDGKKMSKSLRNYTDPTKVMQEFGADALRLFLMNSAVTRADDLCYSDDGVKDVIKSILLPLWSAYSFFVTYARLDEVTPGEAAPDTGNPLDRWILSVAETMVSQVSEGLESYEMQKAIEPILTFIDALNNWYIRRSRRRFWRSENDSDKVEAYAALYRVLKRLILCLAPFTPFIAEAMWQNLRRDDEAASIHLADWPESDKRYIDEELEWKMAAVRKTVSMGRALRTQHNLKTRQPLSEVQLVTREARERAVLLEMEDIIRDELNVKSVVFKDNEEELVEYKAKANFRVLGKELGKDMKEGAALIEQLGGAEISSLLDGAELQLEVAGRQLVLTKDKLDIQRIEKASLRVINEGTLTVALNADITPELLAEGYARDLVRGIQTLRKDSGFAVSDRIELKVFGSDALKAAFEEFSDFVCSETLTVQSDWEESAGMSEVDAGEETWKIAISKV
ncbi:MAG: isoleucine--tRNA ligase [Spirochaetes bacterium]|nr:isoleucine--tRNA ligase [Spirochaetota bacterium]